MTLKEPQREVQLILSRKDAAVQGLLWYYTGKPCIHGHVSRRHVVGGWCYECNLEKNRRERSKMRAAQAKRG